MDCLVWCIVTGGVSKNRLVTVDYHEGLVINNKPVHVPWTVHGMVVVKPT